MHRFPVLCLGLLLCGGMCVLVSPPDLVAQELERLQGGERVRVHNAGVAGEFIFREMQADTLVLQPMEEESDPLVRVPMAGLRTLEVEVSRAGRGFRRGGLIGLGVAGGAGAILGAAVGGFHGNPLSGALGVGLVLGVPGGLVGGFIGAAAAGTGWEAIDLEGDLLPDGSGVGPGRGAGLGLGNAPGAGPGNAPGAGGIELGWTVRF